MIRSAIIALAVAALLIVAPAHAVAGHAFVGNGNSFSRPTNLLMPGSVTDSPIIDRQPFPRGPTSPLLSVGASIAEAGLGAKLSLLTGRWQNGFQVRFVDVQAQFGRWGLQGGSASLGSIGRFWTIHGEHRLGFFVGLGASARFRHWKSSEITGSGAVGILPVSLDYSWKPANEDFGVTVGLTSPLLSVVLGSDSSDYRPDAWYFLVNPYLGSVYVTADWYLR